MNERFKELRKFLGLNQESMGEKLGVTNTAVSKWENGERNIPDSAVMLICSKFGVNETWLRTGAGEMFRPRSDAAELGELIRSRLVNFPDSFQASLVKMLLRLDPEGPEMKILERFVEQLAAETKKQDPKP